MGWSVLDNFNEIATQDEKIGGRSRPRKQMDDSKFALERNELVDLGWKNQNFTLSNRHIDENYTKKCLDHFVANKKWLTTFSNPGVEILTTSSLYHCPLILNNVDHNNGSVRRMIFRYEVKWALEEDGEQAVILVWKNISFSPNC